jgi:FtsP/CotA-like multicopper oxidase with cupredoxin domain
MISFLRYAPMSGLLLALAEPCTLAAQSVAEPEAPHTFEITINSRTFNPPVLSLPLQAPVTLIIKNQDGEIHAFVPLLFLQGANVQVTGNGAPEFNETGLARVLIPPHGRAELRFTPKLAGKFFYICDLPGHQMRAQIIVGVPRPPETARR